MKKYYGYAGLALLGIGMFMGGIIASIIFFGILTAASLIVLIETGTKSFKMFMGKYGFLLDLFMYILSVLAIVNVGVTVAGGLGVASLLSTLYRITFLTPWFKTQKESDKPKRSVFSYVCQAFNWVVDGIKSLFTSKTVSNG